MTLSNVIEWLSHRSRGSIDCRSRSSFLSTSTLLTIFFFARERREKNLSSTEQGSDFLRSVVVVIPANICSSLGHGNYSAFSSFVCVPSPVGAACSWHDGLLRIMQIPFFPLFPLSPSSLHNIHQESLGRTLHFRAQGCRGIAKAPKKRFIFILRALSMLYCRERRKVLRGASFSSPLVFACMLISTCLCN